MDTWRDVSVAAVQIVRSPDCVQFLHLNFPVSSPLKLLCCHYNNNHAAPLRLKAIVVLCGDYKCQKRFFFMTQ